METIAWNYITNEPTQVISKMQVNLKQAFKKTLQRLEQEPFIELRVIEPDQGKSLSVIKQFEQYIEEVDQLFLMKGKRLCKSNTLLWLSEVKQCHNELKHLPIASYFFQDMTDIAYWKTANGIYRLIYSQANPESQVIIAMTKTTLQ